MIRPLLLGLLLAAPVTAQAATPCVSRAEGEAIVGWALPSFVEGAARRCRPSLGSGAYLPRSATTLAAKWRSGGADPAKARAALSRVAGATLPGALGQALAQQVDESIVAGALVDSIALKDCGRLDRAIGLAAPLPATAVAGLVTLFVEIGAESDRTALPFRICATR